MDKKDIYSNIYVRHLTDGFFVTGCCLCNAKSIWHVVVSVPIVSDDVLMPYAKLYCKNFCVDCVSNEEEAKKKAGLLVSIEEL